MGVILDLVLVLAVFLIFAVKSSAFQTWLAHRVADYLSGELNADVRIDRVDIDFFDYVTIDGVYISDQRRDTIAYIPRINCTISDISFKREAMLINKAELVDPVIKLTKYEGDTVWNYDFIEEFFSGPKKKKILLKADGM